MCFELTTAYMAEISTFKKLKQDFVTYSELQDIQEYLVSSQTKTRARVTVVWR